MKKIKRTKSFDLLKIISFFAVVMIHDTSNFMNMTALNNYEFYIVSYLNVLSRFAVYVFMMITGALLLNEDKDLSNKRIFKDYILKMAIILLFWLTIHTLFYFIFTPDVIFTPKEFINCMILRNGYGNQPLWYLYFLLGAYLLTPILRLFVKRENKKYILYLIALLFIFNLIPAEMDSTIQTSSKIFSLLAGKFTIGSLPLFLLLGWYLNETEFKKNTNYLIYTMAIVSLIINFIIGLKNNEQSVNIADRSNFICNYIYYISVFVFFKNKFKNSESEALTVKIAKLTFGGYVIHDLVQTIIFQNASINNFYNINVLGAMIFIFITVSISSLLISWIFSKIPICRYLIYYK